jgi:hypothetical protein
LVVGHWSLAAKGLPNAHWTAGYPTAGNVTMSNRIKSRLIATLIVGLLVGTYIRHDITAWSLRGRDAFMLHEARRFDMYMATPQPAWITITGAAILVIGITVVYELLVATIRKMLGKDELGPLVG